MCSDPFGLFSAWYAEAVAEPQIRYPHAACLSTVDSQGDPDARIVLVHEFDAEGFLFSTDRRSSKARQLAERPRAALTFYWEPLERQVRLRGGVRQGTEGEANRCFAERPRGSRLTAWACCQSSEIQGREELAATYARVTEDFAGQDEIPRPAEWCAYRLLANRFEFWQASRHRLHRRHVFERRPSDGDRAESPWRHRLLAP